jgi:hypothetical protein
LDGRHVEIKELLRKGKYRGDVTHNNTTNTNDPEIPSIPGGQTQVFPSFLIQRTIINTTMYLLSDALAVPTVGSIPRFCKALVRA